MIIIRDILNSPPTNASRQRKGAREVEENPQEPIDGADDSIMSPLQASQLLTDEYSAKILLATYKRKISAQEISQRYGIPIAACYRKIRTLEEVGLIQCVDRILTQKGKRKNLYTSCLRNAYIFFENGKLRARFQLATGVVQDFGGDWNGLDLLRQ
jgi:ribosomal protein S25